MAVVFISSIGAASIFGGPTDPVAKRIALAEATRASTDGLSVVATSPLVYLEDQHLAGLRFNGSFQYVADIDSAVKYTQASSAEVSLLRLEPWAPLRVSDYETFIAEHENFILWHRPGDRFEWILKRLKDEGHIITPLAKTESRTVLRCCD